MRARALALPAVALALLAPAALADGDPASDYLLTQSTYLSAAVSRDDARQIVSLLAKLSKAGFPLKVAVIASPRDLGADPELFAKPKLYAKFLATEDRLVWQNQLLVVMASGYGLYKRGGLPAGDVAAIAKLPRPGRALGAATERAIRALAARRSISLGGGGFPNWAVALLALVGGWLVLLAGGVVLSRSRGRPETPPRTPG